jgi:hypothetical protein
VTDVEHVIRARLERIEAPGARERQRARIRGVALVEADSLDVRLARVIELVNPLGDLRAVQNDGLRGRVRTGKMTSASERNLSFDAVSSGVS